MREIIYRIDRPFADGVIDVYAQEEGTAVYEWRIVRHGETLYDTGNAGYESPGVALRDALIWDTDQPTIP